MAGATDIERYPQLRCPSHDVEGPGRTHDCRLTAGHQECHKCVCTRSWDALSGGQP